MGKESRHDNHTEGSASEATSSVVESRQLRDQPFRIYRVVPELDKITVYARHVFYDLLDNMIKSYKPSSSVKWYPDGGRHFDSARDPRGY